MPQNKIFLAHQVFLKLYFDPPRNFDIDPLFKRVLDWHRHQLLLCTKYARLRKRKSLIFVKVVNVKTNKPGESSKQKQKTKNFKSENYQSLK
jgi:hypothetical protein